MRLCELLNKDVADGNTRGENERRHNISLAVKGVLGKEYIKEVVHKKGYSYFPTSDGGSQVIGCMVLSYSAHMSRAYLGYTLWALVDDANLHTLPPRVSGLKENIYEYTDGWKRIHGAKDLLNLVCK